MRMKKGVGKEGRITAKRRTVDVLGLKVQVASDEECEAADFVVCAAMTVPLYFADNLTGPCSDCGDLLQWRPHAPKKPPKICVRCVTIRQAIQQRAGRA